MLQSLTNKLTNGMLWWLVIPIAVLISSLAILVSGYAWVAWHASEISVDSPIGKLTAKIESMQTQVQDASVFLDQQQAQLKLYSEQLEKLLTNIKNTKNSVPTQQQGQGFITDSVTDITGIITKLKIQSKELTDQKKKLESVNTELLQFKQELRGYTAKYTNQK